MLSKPNLTDQLMNINEMYKSMNRSVTYIYNMAKLVCFVFFLYKMLMISILISDMIYHIYALIFQQIDFFETIVNPSSYVKYLILKQICRYYIHM